MILATRKQNSRIILSYHGIYCLVIKYEYKLVRCQTTD